MGPNKDLAAACGDPKRNLQAIAQTIKSYTNYRQRQYRGNVMFKTNAEGFYRDLWKDKAEKRHE